MKQNITIEQLNELSDKGKDKLKVWVKQHLENEWRMQGITTAIKIYELPLLSIGLMIELLEYKKESKKHIWYLTYEVGAWHVQLSQYQVTDSLLRFTKVELCDALWEAVKEVLDN